MERTKETINFVPAGKTILLYPEAEKFGLDLSMVKDYPIDLPVVAVGDDCVKVKVGDRVVCNGTCLTLFVDGKKYLQMFESQVMGFVINGAKVSTEPSLPSTAKA